MRGVNTEPASGWRTEPSNRCAAATRHAHTATTASSEQRHGRRTLHQHTGCALNVNEESEDGLSIRDGKVTRPVAKGHTYEETIEVKGSKGIASGQWKSLFHEEGRAAVANSCTIFRRITTNGTGERVAKFSVPMPEGDQYRIFVSAPSFAATENYESSQCGGYSEQRRSETKTAGGFSLAGLEGKLDPNNPTELSGSKTMPSPMGSRRITWNLNVVNSVAKGAPR